MFDSKALPRVLRFTSVLASAIGALTIAAVVHARPVADGAAPDRPPEATALPPPALPGPPPPGPDGRPSPLAAPPRPPAPRVQDAAAQTPPLPPTPPAVVAGPER